MAVVASLTLLGSSLPAAATLDVDATAHLMWLRCDDESEAFSDEPRLYRPGIGWPIASWQNVDGGDVLDIPWETERQQFSGQLVLNLIESDSGSQDFLGSFVINDYWAGTGERELVVQDIGDYRYVLHFFVTSP